MLCPGRSLSSENQRWFQGMGKSEGQCTALSPHRRKIISPSALRTSGVLSLPKAELTWCPLIPSPLTQKALWLACLFSLGLKGQEGQEAAWPTACRPGLCCGDTVVASLSHLVCYKHLASLANYSRTSTVQRASALR